MLFIDKYMLLSYNIYYQEILYFDWLISKILCYHSSVSITLPFALPLADYWCKSKHRVKNIEKPTDVHWKWVSILSLAIAFTKTACGKNFKTFVSVFFSILIRETYKNFEKLWTLKNFSKSFFGCALEILSLAIAFTTSANKRDFKLWSFCF